MRLKKLGYSLALALSLAMGGEAVAQNGPVVTLKSFDGFTQLRGELLGFDGKVFVLKTRLGTLEIDALQVNCEGDGCPTDLLFGAEFGIHGSNSIGASLMPALIEGYSDALQATLEREIGASDNERTFRIIHQDGEEMAAIDVQSQGTGASFPAIAEGRAVIGMSSRRMSDDEALLLQNVGIGELRNTENEHILALDGMIVITHRSNPIRSVSVAEVAAIFSGAIDNWAQLGGPDAAINLYSRNTDSGTFEAFQSLVLTPNGLDLSGNATQFEDSAELSDAVAADPQGIGFTGFAFGRQARVLPIRQECGLLSYPTTFAVKTEEYPLSRRLYLYTSPDGGPAHARRLVEFALSDDARPYVESAGFISVQPEGQSLSNQGDRLAHAIVAEQEFSLDLMREMLLEFQGAERLSTTFRFTPGSSQLTAKSQGDAQLLAEQLAAGDFAGREVLLVGFTDAIGQFDLNRELSRRRAQGVLDVLTNAVPQGALASAAVEVRGYGELTPVGCNNTFSGRVANRRVEVWVR